MGAQVQQICLDNGDTDSQVHSLAVACLHGTTLPAAACANSIDRMLTQHAVASGQGGVGFAL
jgi:hypothetical protein